MMFNWFITVEDPLPNGGKRDCGDVVEENGSRYYTQRRNSHLFFLPEPFLWFFFNKPHMNTRWVV